MKNVFFFIVLLLSTLYLWGQNDLPTYGYNYQAVIRSGNLPNDPVVANQSVVLRFLILNSAGQTLYEEIHSDNTDNFGRVARVVGAGAVVSGNFDTLNWAAKKHYLKIRVKIGTGTEVDLGEEEIVHQPFAKGGGDWVNVGDTILFSQGKKIGIGTSNPIHTLDVRGSIYLKNNWSNYRLVASDPTIGDIRWEMAPNGTSYFFNNNTNKYLLHFNSNGRIAVGHTTPQYDFDVNGSLAGNCVAVKGGCDIIENTNSSETLYPGEVIVIDPSRPNHVLRSNKAYDHMTIGVISGAGGITHGMMLSQEGVLDGDVSFAIAGRVKVKVTGKVQPGDLLTTSDVPGHAMAAKNHRKRDGAVIGKALSVPDAEGLVLMLVMMK